MKHFFVLLAVLVLALSLVGYSQVPNKISYQGLLTTSGGAPAIDGNYDLQIDFFDAAVAGSSQWSETHTAVPVQRGTFSIILGSLTSLNNFNFNRQLYIEIIATAGPAGPSYPIMFSPRTALASSPSSLAPWTANGSGIYYNKGNVGIGITIPIHPLDVRDSANSLFAGRIENQHSGGSGLLVRTAGTSSTHDALRVESGGGTSRMIVQNDGNVGIGTTAPAQKLDVEGDMEVGSGAYPVTFFNEITEIGNWGLSLNINGADRAAIDRLGNSFFKGDVGIGTTSPNTKLHVFGGTDASLADGSGFAVIGDINSTNIVIDNNEIIARNNAAISDLYLQALGGRVHEGSGSPNTASKMTIRAEGTDRALYLENNSVGFATFYASNSDANGLAGVFIGNVSVSGNLSKSSGSFKIDHPLDPANKYLLHSFVESPDMMNVYNGNIVLDAKGEASVELPTWFEALNKDFRYQLTAIGAPGPNLYIAQKVKNNRFKIAGGTPSAEISWQVTGIRHDAYANTNRIPVEEDKPVTARGRYLHPEVHGQPREMRIDPEYVKAAETNE